MLRKQPSIPEGDPAALPLSGDASFLLARANALSLAATNRTLEPFTLKARSYSVLALAATADYMSQRDFASYLRLDPSQVVALVDDLQERALVERRSAPGDRRANVVVATDEGRALAAQAHAVLRQAEDALLSELDDSERATLAALLRKVAFTD